MNQPTEQPSSGSSDPRRNLEDAVSQLEAKLAAQRPAGTNEAADRASIREGVYMVIFEAFLLAFLTGFLGKIEHADFGNEPRRHDFFLDGLVRDTRGVADGFIRELPEMWPVLLAFMAITMLLSFGVRRTKARRRYFMLVYMLTALVLTLRLLDALNSQYL